MCLIFRHSSSTNKNNRFTMQLFIMRHGEAAPFQQPDAARMLTDRGEIEAEAAGGWLAKQCSKIDLALVSPYVRAEQTFTEACKQVSVTAFESINDLIPEGNPKIVHDYVDTLIAERKDIDNLLIVSHMPLVCHMVSEFAPGSMPLAFATAAIAQIDYSPLSMTGRVEAFYGD